MSTYEPKPGDTIYLAMHPRIISKVPELRKNFLRLFQYCENTENKWGCLDQDVFGDSSSFKDSKTKIASFKLDQVMIERLKEEENIFTETYYKYANYYLGMLINQDPQIADHENFEPMIDFLKKISGKSINVNDNDVDDDIHKFVMSNDKFILYNDIGEMKEVLTMIAKVCTLIGMKCGTQILTRVTDHMILMDFTFTKSNPDLKNLANDMRKQYFIKLFRDQRYVKLMCDKYLENPNVFSDYKSQFELLGIEKDSQKKVDNDDDDNNDDDNDNDDDRLQLSSKIDF